MLISRSFGTGRVSAIIFAGVAVRLTLHRLGFQSWLEGASELVVPHASWERAQEGLFLSSLGLSHYAGGVFSGSPLMLAVVTICRMLPGRVQMLGAALIFTAFDVMSALLLRAFSQHVISAESCDWETELEAWMDEDSRPPGYTPPPGERLSSEGKSAIEAVGVGGPGQEGKGGADAVLPGDGNRGTPGDGSSVGERRTGKWDSSSNLPDVVLALYLLNPVMVGQCAALSGDVLGRVLPLGALVAGAAGSLPVAGAGLAAATCLYRFHAALLAVPVALMLTRQACPSASALLNRTEARDRVVGGQGQGQGGTGTHEKGGDEGEVDTGVVQKRGLERESSGEAGDEHSSGANKHDDSGIRASRRRKDGSDAIAADFLEVRLDPRVFMRLLVVFAASCGILLGACWLGNSRSWEFLRAAIAAQLLCDDLSPNPGLFWYFFAQIFARFRGFFRVLFLSQPYLYVIPITLRIGMFPEATATILSAVFGFFHTHPTLADSILSGCMFLCHPRSAKRMRFVVTLGLMGMVPAMMLPTMRHVWLIAGTGNANFYYFQGVALNVFLSVFLLQFLSAVVKRRKALATALRRREKASDGVASAVEGVGMGIPGKRTGE